MAKNQNIDDLISRLEEKEKESTIIYADEETEQVVIFELSGTLFAFPGKNISEILPYESITTLPGLPNQFLGFITLRGAVEAVLDPRKILNLQITEPGNSSRILISSNEEFTIGVWVDTVSDVADIPKSQIHPPIKTFDQVKAEFISGEFEYKDKHIVYLSIAKFFSALQASVNE